MLSEYINPKPNMLTEWYTFKERKQELHKLICQFVIVLKKLSQFCEFFTILDNSLCDQIMYGIGITILRNIYYLKINCHSRGVPKYV